MTGILFIYLLMALELHQALQFSFLCGKYFICLQTVFQFCLIFACIKTGNLIETTKLRNHQHTGWEAALLDLLTHAENIKSVVRSDLVPVYLADGHACF